MKKIVTFVRLRIEHEKPIKDLAEKAAQRVYNLSGIDNCEVVNESVLVELPAKEQPSSNGHSQEVTAQMAQAMDSTMGQLS